jgi:hypothetical protein
MSKYTKKKALKKRIRRHWTPTDLKTAEGCLRRYYDLYEGDEGAGTVRPPSTPALDKGNFVHNTLEKYLLGGNALSIYKEWHGELDTLRRIEAIPEQLWELDASWQARVGAAALWARMKTDAHHIDEQGASALVVDFKTGRIYPEHKDLMELYALALAKRAPKVKKLRVELWYLDQNEVGEKEYDRDELEALYSAWTKRAGRVLSATTFAPTPSEGACRFCHNNRKNGGDCPVAV